MIAGVAAGGVILIMALTGTCLAFEKQLLAWAEGSNRKVRMPAGSGKHATLQALVDRIRAEHGRMPMALTLHADPSLAVEVLMSHDEVIYWDGSTQELRPSQAGWMRSILRALVSWHRWLGLEGEYRPWGRAITGACNLAFVLLILTGAILWWPTRGGARAWRGRLWFQRRVNGRARDWNWHHVLGFWCGPILLVLSSTAIVISYAWAARWVESLGTGASSQARGAMPEVPSARQDANPEAPPSLDEIWQVVQARCPSWERVTIRFGTGPRGGPVRSEQPPGGQSPSPGSGSMREPRRAHPARATQNHPGPSTPAGTPSSASGFWTFAVRERLQWPLFASTQLQVEPRTAEILLVQGFDDLPTGRRLRMWFRYLHTGEALGWPGQLIAMAASAGAVVLVWTGLALSWCRFFPNRKNETVPGSARH